jgi:YcxB-like protein
MEIVITLDKEDWRKFSQYFWRKLAKESRSFKNDFWLSFIVGGILGMILIFAFPDLKEIHWPSAGVATAFFVFIVAVYFFKLIKFRKACEPSGEGTFVGEHEFIFDDQGIQTQGRGYESRHAWSVVKGIERAQGMVLIYYDTAMALVFPENKLNNPDEFYSFIDEKYSKAMGEKENLE